MSQPICLSRLFFVIWMFKIVSWRSSWIRKASLVVFKQYTVFSQFELVLQRTRRINGSGRLSEVHQSLISVPAWGQKDWLSNLTHVPTKHFITTGLHLTYNIQVMKMSLFSLDLVFFSFQEARLSSNLFKWFPATDLQDFWRSWMFSLDFRWFSSYC